MRMTRDIYAKEVWKAVEAVSEGQDEVLCPHLDCKEQVSLSTASMRSGAAIVCPEHGVIYRE